MDKRLVLVAGASGFIGRCLRHSLAGSSHFHLHGLSRSPQAGSGFFEFSALALAELSQMASYETVINLAAHIGDSKGDSLESNIEGNVASTSLLLDFAKRNGAKQFIHISSFSIFDGLRGASMRIDEETEPAPISFYSQTKLSSEHLVIAERKSFERGVVIVRPAFTYGAGMRNTRMIPFFIKSLMCEETLEVYDPDTWLQLSLVDDVADVILSALRLNSSEIINAVNQQMSKIQMSKIQISKNSNLKQKQISKKSNI